MRVRLGATGGFESWEADSSPAAYKPVFSPELERTARMSQYAQACAGRTVELVFKFQLGDAFGDSGGLTWFEAPNRFVITARSVPFNK